MLQTKDKTDTYGREPFRWPLSTAPYKGGYPDFMMGQSGFKGVSKGPPRSSMLDDLCYYLTAYDLNLLDLNNDKCPPALGVFAEKIIASHYASLTLFMSTVLSIQQSALSRQDNMSLFSLSTVEQQWSDIQAWERRLNEYCTDIEDLMLKLSVPFQDPDPSQIQASTWYSSTTDFQFLRMRLQQLRNRAEQVNAATSGLASIAGNRQAHQEQQLSSREALRTKALTLVGLVFIPLAYTATLFSMDDQYMPGAKHFWIYFCVAVPLIFTVLGAYWLLDKVYGNEGSSVLDFSRFKNTPWKKYVFMDRKQHFDASSC